MHRMRTFILFALALSAELQASEKRIAFGAVSAADGSAYEVGFCARDSDAEGGGPGHAYVVLRKLDKNKAEVEFLTAGFGPQKSAPVHRHGLISPENYSHPSQHCLIAETNAEKYQQIKQGIADKNEFTFAGTTIKLTRPYVVALDDCVTFLQSVAEDFGLDTPSRLTHPFPLSYVKAMMEMN